MSEDDMVELYDLTSYLPKDVRLAVRKMYILSNEMILCKVCGGYILKQPVGNIPKFCSKACRVSPEGKVIMGKTIEKTMVDKYGVKNAMYVDEFKENLKNTCIEKYGVDNVNKNAEVREKLEATNVRRYGHSCVLSNTDVYNKTKKTMMIKYGVEKALCKKEFSDKASETFHKNYGPQNPKNRNMLQQKKEATNMAKYGTLSPMQNKEIQNKQITTNIAKYGIDFPLRLPEIRDKIRATNIVRYGVPIPSQRPEIIEKTAKWLRNDWYDEFVKRLIDLKIEALFSKEDYVEGMSSDNIRFKCLRCDNEFTPQSLQIHKIRCPEHTHRALTEEDVSNWVKSIYSNDVLDNKYMDSDIDTYNQHRYELDVYVPGMKVGIELHGIYWHSDIFKQPRYHKDKYRSFKNIHNIHTIQVFENEWLDGKSREIVKSIIKSKLNAHKTKPIYARKCEIKQLTVDEYRNFCNENHLQGYAAASVKLGLFHNDDLVQIMSFSKSRFNKGYDWENIRSASKINTIVVGGMSRLLKHFRKNNDGSIVSYVDVRYFDGSGYEKNGFELINHTEPNYFYVKNGVDNTLESRNKYQKHKLAKLLENFDPNLSERDNMVNHNFFRIYDAGNLVYVLR